MIVWRSIMIRYDPGFARIFVEKLLMSDRSLDRMQMKIFRTYLNNSLDFWNPIFVEVFTDHEILIIVSFVPSSCFHRCNCDLIRSASMDWHAIYGTAQATIDRYFGE